jgi:hypothetical protein
MPCLPPILPPPQLIRVCSEHGQAVTALSVYEWMKAPPGVGGAGLGPTVFTYTAAMRAALAAGLLDRALQVWDDAQAAHQAGLIQLDCRLCITYIEVSVVRAGKGGAHSPANLLSSRGSRQQLQAPRPPSLGGGEGGSPRAGGWHAHAAAGSSHLTLMRPSPCGDRS